MSDPIQDFEFPLKNHSPKKTSALYRHNQTVNKYAYKPQDVILSVSSQLKAIQMADSLKSNKKYPKELNNHKQPEFLCVNKLPDYEQIRKSYTKFDTQCVTDTQLINIVQDAEVLNAHKGISQEFETAFIHNTDKYKEELSVKSNVICTVGSDNSNNVDLNINDANLLTNRRAVKEITDDTYPKNSNTAKDTANTDNIKPRTSKELDKNVDLVSIEDGKNFSISQILKPKTISNRLYMNKEFYPCLNYNMQERKSHIEEYNQESLSRCIDIQDDDDNTDRPSSPILCKKDLIPDLFLRSPLIYNLDEFEHFERIVVPLIESNGTGTAKHVINSQLLHKELHIQIKEEEKMNKRDVSRLMNDNNKNIGSLIEYRDTKLIELDKVTSDKILDELIYINSSKTDKTTRQLSNDVIKDEILFSSDEEDYVTKDVQDLPFTCALETSFYNQSDVLDKTVYVGFQTASNKSIQVFADSFNKAKSLLTDVSDDKITVTDLVHECEDTATDHFRKEKINIVVNTDEIETRSTGYTIESAGGLRKNNIISEINNCNKLKEHSNLGFSIGNNINTSLHENIPPRCVFHDGDLSQYFETNQKVLQTTEINKKSCYFYDRSELHNPTDDVFQTIDDDIIQEFVNSEMCFEDHKENMVMVSTPVKMTNNHFKNVSENDITGDPKIRNGTDNINLTKSLVEHTFEEASLWQISDETKMKKNDAVINMAGFKTASNKNINISTSAWTKSRNIFENIDLIQFPNKDLKDNKKLNEPYLKHTFRNNENSISFGRVTNNQDANYVLPQMENISNDFDDYQSDACKNVKELLNVHKNVDFVGFKTANNKNIKISAKAWFKTKNIFDNIDSTRLPNEPNKKHPNADLINKKKQEKYMNLNCGIDNELFALSSVNKNAIDISSFREQPSRTSNHYEDCDLSDSPKLLNNRRHITCEEPMDSDKDIPIHEKALSANISRLIGFKTASNKAISISDEALSKTKNLFKDINSIEFRLPNKNKNEFHDNERDMKTVKPINYNEINNDIHIAKDIDLVDISKFQGFKTASDKNIEVSSEALLKTKHIFNDMDKNCGTRYIMHTKLDSSAKDFDKSNDELKTSNSLLLQTENDNRITISQSGLEKDNSLYKKIPLDIFEKPFLGFQTANNKQVKISEKALVNSRKIINSSGILDGENFKNKESKTKGLYPEEFFQCDDIYDSDVQTLNKRETSLCSVFQGFHTASNKTVTVSKTALENCKNLFQSMYKARDFFSECDTIKNSEKHMTETRRPNTANKVEGFKGFQTASNKSVIVSEKALAETKDVFKDLENEYIQETKINIGFQNGNNKIIDVSRDALVNSKRLFAEIDDDKPTISLKKEKKGISNIFNEENIDCFIDTQVMNNFDEALHTEDFRDTPQTSKRSGSPILLCSRTKKRKKFETPYKPETISDLTPKALHTNKVGKKIIYRGDYKKSKKYSLKDLKEITKDIKTKIDPCLLEVNYNSLLHFKFKQDRNDLTEGEMTVDKLKEYFLNTVNPKLIPKNWLDNHLKLILWKLISYEIVFKSIICTSKNVLEQLNYRYEKELYDAERPALRKILEKDDVPSKTMVLCVVEIYVKGVSVTSVTDTSSNIELLVTDGWYCIRCTIDRMLADLVTSSKIRIGCKIVTTGAELIGSDQGVSPWEDTSAVRLKIFGNSTRRARWDARLGYQTKGAILTELSSVKVLGGKVSKLRFFVTRVYPALYVEKFEDGSTVTRSERLENLHQMKTEADRQAFMEKIYEEVEKEFADQESQDSEGLSDSYKRSMDSGSQIAKMMKWSRDPGEFRAQLTHTQGRLLEEYSTKKHDRLVQEIQTRVRERIEKAGVSINRNVVSLLKIRIAGIREKGDNIEVTKGMMSIWKPNDAVQEIIKEGAWIDVMNVVPTSIRNGEIQISAGRQSLFSTSKFKPSEKIKSHMKLLQRQCYTIKDLAQNPAMSTDYNEIDTVGLIFLIDPEKDIFEPTKQSFQNVYMCDTDKNMVCVNFWGGLKKFGFQNVLDTGQVVSCVNLQKRAGNTRKSIPQYRVTEFSHFTQTPRNDNARQILEELNKKMSCLDIRKFCQECLVLKNNYSVLKQNNENVSPYRCMNNSDIDISKNKIFINSPLVRSDIQDNFNLTGLDFESTFKENSQLSEEVLKRRRKTNEKIARLKMYGEPPPLAPMHIINSSKQASSSYKSPLISNNNKSISRNSNTPKNMHQLRFNSKSDTDSIINVADIKNTPKKLGEIDYDISNSPVLLNKTYVKSVNPVKINFDMKDNNDDSNIDHFAEEFDGSPPLSLD